MHSIPAIAPRNLCRSPEAFLTRPIGQTWIKTLAQNYPHARYVTSRSDHFPLRDLNNYASAMLKAKRDGTDPDSSLEHLLQPADYHDTWHHWLEPDLVRFLNNHGKHHTKTWSQTIKPIWEDHAIDADKSCVTDLFQPWHSCEILFAFTETPTMEDHLVYSNKPWSDAKELQINRGLHFALNQIGYSISQFRQHSGNTSSSSEYLPGVRPKRPPIVSYPKLESIIANACSSMFNFYLFAIVPITDIIAIDLSRPIAITPCWLATMNPWAGTFFDEPLDTPITLNPGDGHLISGADVTYSPDQICGLYRSHYAARLTSCEP